MVVNVARQRSFVGSFLPENGRFKPDAALVDGQQCRTVEPMTNCRRALFLRFNLKMEKKMKMKTTLAMFAGFLAFGTASFAQIGDIDLSADGLVSFEELVAVYSEVTEEQFAEIDTNSDGSLDADEMNAAIEAGLLVMSE